MELRALLILLLLTAPGCGESDTEAIEDVRVRVGLVAVDTRNLPVVVLEEEDGPRWLPIWIGTAEARSIASEMEERDPPRPNTHDLARQVIQGLDGEVVRVVVTEIRSSTYYAILALRARGKLIEIDARPSDAIAIALRADAPIFVRAALFDVAGKVSEPEHPGQSVRWTVPKHTQPAGTPSATPPLSL